MSAAGESAFLEDRPIEFSIITSWASNPEFYQIGLNSPSTKSGPDGFLFVRLLSVYLKQQAPRTAVCGSTRGLVLLGFEGASRF